LSEPTSQTTSMRNPGSSLANSRAVLSIMVESQT